jgi:hypothetical protein
MHVHERLRERRGDRIRAASELRGHLREIIQQDARGDPAGFVRFGAANGAGHRLDAREQQLQLRIADFRRLPGACGFQMEPLENRREFVGRGSAIGHGDNDTSAIIHCRGAAAGVGESAHMKTAIKSLMAAFGLAPAAQIDHLNGLVRRAETRSSELEDRLAQLRTEAEGWKRRYDDASEAMAGWKQASVRAQNDADRAKAGADRVKADLEQVRADFERAQARATEWRTRADTLVAELQEMRTRLQNAQSAALSANEQLMAMEVKLDLIEAAIQVLDVRTREQAVVRSS